MALWCDTTTSYHHAVLYANGQIACLNCGWHASRASVPLACAPRTRAARPTMTETYLSKRGYVLRKGATLGHAALAAVRQELTAKPVVDLKYVVDETALHFPVYVETQGKLYVPRAYGVARFGPCKQLPTYDGDDVDPARCEFAGELREYQQQPYRAVVDACGRTGGGILSLQTGLGKTFVALKVAATLRKKTLVIVNKVSLKSQWEAEIAHLLPAWRVGSIQGGNNVCVEDRDIVVAMLQSLALIDYPDALLAGFGLVVVDEVHNVACRTFSKVLFKVCSKYMVGLSATPDRADGLSQVFRWHLGDVVYRSSVERKGLPPVVGVVRMASRAYTAHTTGSGPSARLNFSATVSELIAMRARNDLIVGVLRALSCDDARRVLVLSDRRAHVARLQADFELACPLVSSGLFVGAMKLRDLDRSRRCRVIFATYKAFGEGVSEKDLNTLVLTTPKKSGAPQDAGHAARAASSGGLEQIVGRIFRKEHTDRAPLIVDFVDDFSVFRRQGAGRVAFYKAHFGADARFRTVAVNLDGGTDVQAALNALVNHAGADYASPSTDVTAADDRTVYETCQL